MRLCWTFARDQPAIDFDLTPVGNHVDALPPLDPAHREGGRPQNRVGGTLAEDAGILGKFDEHPAHPVDGVDSEIRRRAVAGHAPRANLPAQGALVAMNQVKA